MACKLFSPTVKGVLVPGLFSIWINSFAALVVCSVVYNQGIMSCCGKNSTTSEYLSPLVLGV